MDLFKLGFRNVIGITLPGTILIIILLYFSYIIIFFFDSDFSAFEWVKDVEILILLAIFLGSYIIGSLLRLNGADKLDKKSSAVLLKEWCSYEENKDWCQINNFNTKDVKNIEKTTVLLQKTRDFINKPNNNHSEIDRWIWRCDSFPYSIWQFRKFQLYHPPEVGQFFERYKNSMGLVSGNRGKEFFNFCKMAIYNSRQQFGDSLIQEVHLAEAIIRYYAGTYYSLFYSTIILFFLFILQLIALFIIPPTEENIIVKIFFIIFTVFIAISAFIMKNLIVKRFRTLRSKEVDIVYDAFYLIQSQLNNRQKVAKAKEGKKGEKDEKYIEREKLIREAYAPDNKQNAFDLDTLSSLMKSKSKKNSYLSSIYFAGAEMDHPFALKTDRMAIGIAVLPEDAPKAGLSKSHPHQKEVVVVLDGSLFIEILQGKTKKKKLLKQGDVITIREGQCHRITPNENKDASFLFVKTNPSLEPRSEDCNFDKKE